MVECRGITFCLWIPEAELTAVMRLNLGSNSNRWAEGGSSKAPRAELFLEKACPQYGRNDG